MYPQAILGSSGWPLMGQLLIPQVLSFQTWILDV